MPAISYAQHRYIFALRSKYKSKSNTPKTYQWIWESGWSKIAPNAKKN